MEQVLGQKSPDRVRRICTRPGRHSHNATCIGDTTEISCNAGRVMVTKSWGRRWSGITSTSLLFRAGENVAVCRFSLPMMVTDGPLKGSATSKGGVQGVGGIDTSSDESDIEVDALIGVLSFRVRVGVTGFGVTGMMGSEGSGDDLMYRPPCR